MSSVADVLFADRLSAEEAEHLRRGFAAVGVTAEIREVAARRSVGDLAWLLLAALPLQPFFEQLAKDSAVDAYARLKSFVHVIFRGRPAENRERPKVLLLQDSTTGVEVVLEHDLPDEAYHQLMAFEFDAVRRGPLHYDRHHHRWRSELDEADRARSS